jgi:lipopolysaccharide biosynthesis glycosyltransferase
MSCSNKILFIPPKYNATYPIRAKGAGLWDLFSKEELSETPVIYHFTAAKPWNSMYMDQSKVWWDFLKKYDFDLYCEFLSVYRKSQTLMIITRRFYNRRIQTVKRLLSK